jgi:hypothetical protein
MFKLALGFVLSVSAVGVAGCKKQAGETSASGSGGAAVLAGSSSGSGSAHVAGEGCRAAVEHSMVVGKADLMRAAPALTEDMVAKLVAVALAHCTADAWSDEVIQCYQDGKTEAELTKCNDKLTPDQLSKFQTDATNTVTTMLGSGSDNGDHGCTAALDNALPLELDALKKSGAPDAMLAKFKDLSIAHCKADRWSNDILACMAKVKTAGEITGCGKLTPDQTTALENDLKAAMVAMSGSGSGSGSGSAPATSALPKECEDYKAAMAKVNACDKLPANSKAMLQMVYEQMAKPLANFANMAPTGQQTTKDVCTENTKTLMIAAKQVCGL